MVRRLKELRQEKKISQQQLADVVMVSQQSINKYENHNVEPDIATLIKIADYFDVSIDYLVGRSDTKYVSSGMSIEDLDKTEKKVIGNFRLLNEKQQKCIVDIIESYK